jgi:glycosyltransferase involved in cell wall biosynthesis
MTETKRPRLLVIGPTPPPHHGISTFMERLLVEPALHAAFDVRHLETADRRGLDNLGQLDARNVVLGLRHAAELLALLVRHRPHVVYFEISQNTWAYVRDSFWILLPKLVGSRVAVRLNGSDFRDFYGRCGLLTRSLIRVTSRRLDAVAVLGERLRPLYDGLVPAERVSVVPNGAADLFPEEELARLGRLAGGAAGRTPGADSSRVPAAPTAAPAALRGAPVRVTYLGALYRPKGIMEFIRAAALLRERGCAVEFTAAGGWFCEDTRKVAESAITALGMDGVIRFPGIVAGEDKLALLRQTDVLVFPGVQAEGQPFVILEAMAAGVPVVSTAKGAIEDMVVHGETGLIVPDRSPEAIADAVQRLVEHPGERLALGLAGRQRFLERFTDERSLEQLLAWLLGLVGSGSGGAEVAVVGAGPEAAAT